MFDSVSEFNFGGYTMRRIQILGMITLLVFAIGCSSDDGINGGRTAGVATYTVTFESTWSAVSHPDSFPPNPHFSGLIGAGHNGTVSFWSEGELASPGIKNMAETGSKSPFTDEIAAAIAAGSADRTLSGDGIGTSPGTVSLTFDITEQFPLVTLVSMVAPSPDWFVGISSLNLLESSEWIESLSVELFAYDAGTDSGTTYTSADMATDPPENIARINSAPFLVNDEVPLLGTFTFTLQ
jgi:hypothetical protein